MRMNTFELKVIAIDKTFFTGKCQQVIVSATDGSIGIMAHHENTVMALVEGPMRIQLEDGTWLEAQIAYNRVTILVDFAEKPEEIDERRAKEALERAQEAMRQKQSIQEYHMSQANMARAMARLAVKKHYTKDK